MLGDRAVDPVLIEGERGSLFDDLSAGLATDDAGRFEESEIPRPNPTGFFEMDGTSGGAINPAFTIAFSSSRLVGNFTGDGARPGLDATFSGCRPQREATFFTDTLVESTSGVAGESLGAVDGGVGRPALLKGSAGDPPARSS
jgi:hypothetical protein